MVEKNLKSIIAKITRQFAKDDISYQESQYIIKGVRQNLELKAPKSKKGTVKRLSRTELKTFLDEAFQQHPKIGLMMLTLYETGGRLNEFTSFDASDLYPEEMRMVIKSGKGDKRREVPITRHLVNMLKLHLNKRIEGPLFRSQRGKRFSDRRIQQIVKDIGISAKISIKITPHTLRHTRGTLLVEDGISKEWIQQFYGHEKMDTTEIYTRTAMVDLDKEFREKASDYSEY